jgi:hypothetical protein
MTIKEIVTEMEKIEHAGYPVADLVDAANSLDTSSRELEETTRRLFQVMAQLEEEEEAGTLTGDDLREGEAIAKNAMNAYAAVKKRYADKATKLKEFLDMCVTFEKEFSEDTLKLMDIVEDEKLRDLFKRLGV